MKEIFFALLLSMITVNIVRFFLKPFYHRLFLSIAGSALLITASVALHLPIPLATLGGIAVSAISFSITGGVLGAVIVNACFLILFPGLFNGSNFTVKMTLYLAAGVLIGGLVKVWRWQVWERYHQMQSLYRQARELQFLREFSLGMQSTFDVENLLHIVLTSITAGSGLGLNRAVLLLLTDDEKELRGAFAIGPLSEDEGYLIWNHLVETRWNLQQLMERKDKIKIENSQLNDIVAQLNVPLNEEGGILAQAARDQQVIQISAADSADSFVQFLYNRFDMSAFAVVPLVNRSHTVGLILVDNVVSHKPITAEKLESISILARHAAATIENAALYKQMRNMAITDGLTGLHNQRFFSTMLQEYYDRAVESNCPLCIILLDIDDFKYYNDHNGHLAGNEILKAISHIVSQSTRSLDLTCRFGGEEFAVLLPDTDIDSAFAVAQAIHGNVAKAILENGDRQPLGRITVSIGVSGYPHVLGGPQVLVDAADVVMYQAKAAGKNRVICAGRNALNVGSPA